jgi:prepilin-type N-terminal cleavage/methylation domain-containing protein
MNRTRAPHGFTLVELLVVASLLAVLFGMVLAAGRGGQKSDVRRAAQECASLLLSAQSRALGRPEGAAVMVEALSDNARVGGVLHDAIMQPPLLVGVANGQLQATADELAGGYKVRFRTVEGNGRLTVSPWLGLRNGQLQLRESAGQTPENTLLAPPGGNLDALVVRHPVTGPKPIKLSSRVAIDLRHSGVGDDPAAQHGFGRFEGQAPVAIVFDQTGRVAEVIQQVGATGGTSADPFSPNETIYLLFADREAVDQDASLTSDKSVWVAINPQTGRINVSSNNPSTVLATAREKARRAIAVGK